MKKIFYKIGTPFRIVGNAFYNVLGTKHGGLVDAVILGSGVGLMFSGHHLMAFSQVILAIFVSQIRSIVKYHQTAMEMIDWNLRHDILKSALSLIDEDLMDFKKLEKYTYKDMRKEKDDEHLEFFKSLFNEEKMIDILASIEAAKRVKSLIKSKAAATAAEKKTVESLEK